jgi:hypothetical protein
LRIDDTENGVGVGLSVNMGDTPVVTDDRDVLGLFFSAGNILLRRRLRCARHAERREDEQEGEFSHSSGFCHKDSM